MQRFAVRFNVKKCLQTADYGCCSTHSNSYAFPLGYIAVWSGIRTVHCVSTVMARAQKPYFVSQRNGRVHFNRLGHQFSRLLAAEVCASAVVMLDTPRSEVMWIVLATHSILQFLLHFPSRASPCAIKFQLGSATLQGILCWKDCPRGKWCNQVARMSLFSRNTSGTSGVFFIRVICVTFSKQSVDQTAQRTSIKLIFFACNLSFRHWIIINVSLTKQLFNLLKPTGYVMHQQFNLQQLHALPTLYLCVLYLSENKQRLVPLTA